MLSNFPYITMMITGMIHSILGFIMFIIASIGIHRFKSVVMHVSFRGTVQIGNIYLGSSIAASLWIIMVGILGILTGVKRDDHRKTHGLKIGYMVTSILSATIFSMAGITLFALYRLSFDFKTMGLLGCLCSFADFVLSIISASICCCCSSVSSPGATIDGASPEFPPTGNYPPGNYPHGNYPPGNYYPGQFPPGNQIQGNYPPSSYPDNNVQYAAQGQHVNLAYPGHQQNFNPPPDYEKKN